VVHALGPGHGKAIVSAAKTHVISPRIYHLPAMDGALFIAFLGALLFLNPMV
jgi:ABC-type nickel/cobalt efflux system permease component RcnA